MDGPNKDVLWTPFGRAMPIGKDTCNQIPSLKQQKYEKIPELYPNVFFANLGCSFSHLTKSRGQDP